MGTNIYNALAAIQKDLNAPKGQYNQFGKYKYRSLEDINEAVKPLLATTGTVLTIGDELVQVGERYYIKATATLLHCESGESIGNTAYAREDESKKGMDGSQITGTASSYARKYAVNGLFAIDDTKDADTDSYQNQTTNFQQAPKAKKTPDYQCAKCGVQITKALHDNTVKGAGISMCKQCADEFVQAKAQVG